ncbi:MAG TPA: hypothetical protein P5234_12185, partial [Thermoanaerobaculaceae bacterium]|nr:hypothetical protein [Thermoanaerobaculaceae bacterium]HRS16990.1 hypothetical protein [Thermoanaerobaculaceae bacterium]
MYLRITSRTNKDGSKAACVQLAHDIRDPIIYTPKAEILFNLGRRDRFPSKSRGSGEWEGSGM